MCLKEKNIVKTSYVTLLFRIMSIKLYEDLNQCIFFANFDMIPKNKDKLLTN